MNKQRTFRIVIIATLIILLMSTSVMAVGKSDRPSRELFPREPRTIPILDDLITIPPTVAPTPISTPSSSTGCGCGGITTDTEPDSGVSVLKTGPDAEPDRVSLLKTGPERRNVPQNKIGFEFNITKITTAPQKCGCVVPIAQPNSIKAVLIFSSSGFPPDDLPPDYVFLYPSGGNAACIAACMDICILLEQCPYEDNDEDF